MNYEFTKLSEVESLNEVPENATVLAEVDGKIKRVPSGGLGGSGGVKTAIIKQQGYDELIAFLAGKLPYEPELGNSYSCTNMTFEEAYETMARGEFLSILMAYNGQINPCNVYFMGTYNGEPQISFIETGDYTCFIWSANGIKNQLVES